MPYSDYFRLSERYFPVLSEANIPQSRWQDTYPHETFVTLLKMAESMLSRQDNNAKKGLWIHGAFGTGKSRVAWTLKELLTCPPEALKSYFAEYPQLRGQQDLRERLLALKASNRIVAAMRFGTGFIGGLDDLIIAIYQSVRQAVEAAGFNAFVTDSMQGAIVEWLQDPVNRDILTTILKAEPYCYDGNLPDSADAVLDLLSTSTGHESLLRKLLQIGRERRLINLTFDMDSLIVWLRQVIEQNKLTAIVLVWDEFSDFLRRNRKIYGEFQKLGEASSAIPFYLMLVSHQLDQIFMQDDPASQVMMDRFNRLRISLPDQTAFKLLAHALTLRPGMEAEWGLIAEDLNSRLEDARRAVKKMVPRLEVEDFKGILPIHPYAALILKHVAEYFDANQRSMFNFVATREKDVKAFQYFIHHYGPEDGELLSIDHLWDYFYETGEGKLGTGRDNLMASIRIIMDTYPLVADKYDSGLEGRDSPQQRVLKTVIMLQALRYMSPKTAHFNATAENLEVAFYGIDELDQGQGRRIADQLVADRVFFVDQGVYQVPLGHAVDQRDIQKLMDEMRKSLTTASMLGSIEPWDIIPPSAQFQERFSVRKLTARDFKRDLNRLIGEEARSYRPKVAMLFARNGAEVDQMQELLQEARANERAANILFIDATLETLPPSKEEKYIQAIARYAYFSGKDDAQAKREGELAESIVREWAARISHSHFVIHGAKLASPIHAANGDELVEELKGIMAQRYPAYYDFAPGTKNTHFKPSVGSAVIKAGIAGTHTGAIVKESVAQLLKGIQVEKYWELVPHHPLSQLKQMVEKKAARAFAPGGSGRLAVGEMVADFMAQGFMPVTLYAWLAGYLLREYADGQYRYSDNDIGDVMTADRLAIMIEAAFKHILHPEASYREQYIEVLTREQRAFVALASQVFQLPEHLPLEQIAHRIGDIVKTWGYPFWAFKYAPEAPPWEEFIDLFCQYLFPENHGRGSYGEVASDMGKLAARHPEAAKGLEQLFTQENLQKGMEHWLERWQEGELLLLGAEIGAPDVLADVRGIMVGNAGVLWNEQVFSDALQDILRGYRLAAESLRRGFLSHAHSREDCLEGWRDKLYQLHVPAPVLAERYPDQKQLIKVLEDLARGKILTQMQFGRLLDAVVDQGQMVEELFANAFAVFRAAFGAILGPLPERDVRALYERLPASSFRTEREAFAAELKVKVQELGSRLKHGQLLALWQDITGTENPAAAARQLATPMAAILQEGFDGEAYAAAVRACRAMDNGDASAAETEAALAFVNGHGEELKGLVTPKMASRAFVAHVLGPNKVILRDAQEARRALAKKLGPDVNGWLEHPRWREIVQELATAEYKSYGVTKVRQKLAAMSEERAKKLLARLGEESFEVGMHILAD